MPAFGHVRYVGKIIRWLNESLPDGRALPGAPVLTADGIKGPDVTWIGLKYARELEADVPLVLERAPEICVEVLSPSNSEPEMNEKRALYFEAGAPEVWLCGRDGKMEFYTPGKGGGFPALLFISPASYDCTRNIRFGSERRRE